MKKSIHVLAALALGLSVMTLSGCKKKSKTAWDSHAVSSPSANRSLWGNEADDRFLGPSGADFVSLKDEDLRLQFADGAVPQPAFSPGERGSGLPGHEMFLPASDKLANVFRNVYFNTDEYAIKNKQHLIALENVADYLRKHSDTYVFIEGYCDERGPEAYNMSLGARRANFVRGFLVQKGVNPDQLHTISFGKEKPLDTRHSSEAWSKNRRAEFKIFQGH